MALFQGGRVPAPSRDDLCEMVQHFGAARGLGLPSEAVSETGPLSLAAGSFEFGENFLRVWHVSDGLNFAFFTYTCEAGAEAAELPACEEIVRSIEFDVRR